MHHLRGAILLLLALLTTLSTGGCAFQQHREDFARTYMQAGPDKAIAMLDNPKVKRLYGEQDRLLYLLDRGTLALVSGDPVTALDRLEQAEGIMDYGGQERRSTADGLAEWLINDTAATYMGEPYESIYLNVLKLCAQLTRDGTTTPTPQQMGAVGGTGAVSGGATVEARRANAKADFLRRRFESGRADLEQKAERRDLENINAPGLPRLTPDTAGQFIESPLGTYLAAIAFMKSGDTDLQQVAARRLTDAVQAQGRLIGTVDAEAFKGLADLRPDDANILLVAFSGFAPIKVPQRIGPIPIASWPLYFEIPVLRVTPSSVARVRATLTPTQPSEANPPQLVDMNLIENMAAVAEENHRRQLPQIYARALVRSSIRSGLSFAATQAIRNNTDRGSGRDAATIAAVVGGLALLAATERADTRCWATLPGQAHVALARLPAGTFDATIEYLDAAGRPITSRTVKGLTASDAPAALSTALTFCTR